MQHLKALPDVATAILGATHLDHYLGEFLLHKMVPLHPSDENRLFGGDQQGIISSTDAKICVAYAMGLIGPAARDSMVIINSIRNSFAHSKCAISFNNEKIVKDCENLRDLWGASDFMYRLLKVSVSSPKHIFSGAVMTWCYRLDHVRKIDLHLRKLGERAPVKLRSDERAILR